jgi:hypothetical protein
MSYQKQEIFPGLCKYSNVFTKKPNLISTVENAIQDSNGKYQWNDAEVGHDDIIKDYRDCKDFKLGRFENQPADEYTLVFDQVWKDILELQDPAVKEYCNFYNIKMDFCEWINVVKYGPNQYFKEHADHGYSYVSTVSLVGYPNKDYVGGSLYFPKLGINIEPEEGDLYIFPSTYLFSHVAMPVQSGVKYSFVTMLDYNDYTHTDEYEQFIKNKYLGGK